MQDCVGSLRATPKGRAMALGILDCGLTEEQRAWCRAQGATLVVPQWDFEFPGRDKLQGRLQGADGAAVPAALLPGLRALFLDRRRLLGAAGRRDRAVPRRGAHRRARRGAGDPSLDAPLSPCLGRVLDGQRRGLRSLLRQGDGRTADPLSHDQCRRLCPPGRRAALVGLGRRSTAKPCSARPI